eukprot:jgi/Chlat1/4995/Chrsp32S04971
MATEEVAAVAQEFVTFLNEAWTPFHAVAEAKKRLGAAGYSELLEKDGWNLQPGGKYFFTRNMSTIVAFAVGSKFQQGNGVVVVGAHTDSPALKLKPVSKGVKGGFLTVGVQTYGGGLWHTWFDRDLSVAGRVLLSRAGGKYSHELVRISKPILRIPNLAIHLYRELSTEGFKPNTQTHLVPVLATKIKAALNGEGDKKTEKGDKAEEGEKADKENPHHAILLQLLANELQCQPLDILDFELQCCDTQPSAIGGALDEFIFSGRLDNLGMSFCALKALLESTSDSSLANEKSVRMVALFDHEEVGSDSAQGAGSPVMMEAVKRVTTSVSDASHKPDENVVERAIRRSYCVSADMAHCLHPNYPDKHEEHHQPQMHKGLVIKTNANQRYATNAVTACLFRELARRHNLPTQEFVVRNDMPCGSTIGPIIASHTGIRTVDVGIPQLAMHSIREICGTDDLLHAVNHFKALFEEFTALDEQLVVDGPTDQQQQQQQHCTQREAELLDKQQRHAFGLEAEHNNNNTPTTVMPPTSPSPSTQNSSAIVTEFLSFLNEAWTPFHAVAEAKKMLFAAGYSQLLEKDAWALKPGGKYFFTRNMSTLVAFAVGSKFEPGNGVVVVGAHTDSPCLKLKPVSKGAKGGYLTVGVQTYGGGLWHTWFDRDLSVAGRVLLSRAGQYSHELVKISRPIMRIPNLAIHLYREVNTEGFKPNTHTHLVPVLATNVKAALTGVEQGAKAAPTGEKADVPDVPHHPLLLQLLADELKCLPSEILDFELQCCDTQPSVVAGAMEEFIFSGRLDNLCMSYCSLNALVETSTDGSLADEKSVRMVTLFDHEEVGSESAHGAGSPVMLETVKRVTSSMAGFERDDVENVVARALRRSYCVSADMAHALHPNYPEKHEEQHQPQLHKGLVIKTNANQRYATNAEFVVRNDMACGSTIGPIIASHTGMRTVDVGVPQLAMHSIREICGTDDVVHAVNHFKALFRHFTSLDEQLIVDGLDEQQ